MEKHGVLPVPVRWNRGILRPLLVRLEIRVYICSRHQQMCILTKTVYFSLPDIWITISTLSGSKQVEKWKVCSPGFLAFRNNCFSCKTSEYLALQINPIPLCKTLLCRKKWNSESTALSSRWWAHAHWVYKCNHTQHNTTQHNTTQHSTAKHNTTQQLWLKVNFSPRTKTSNMRLTQGELGSWYSIKYQIWSSDQFSHLVRMRSFWKVGRT